MNRRVVISIISAALIVGFGFTSLRVLAVFKKRPAEATPVERSLRVDMQVVQPETVQVFIGGFGEVRARDVVTIATEVQGRITQVHPRLDTGEVIPKGEVLFVIDPRTFQALVEDAQARVAQWGTGIERLTKQRSNDQKRLRTLERSRDLAKDEFKRLEKLFTEEKVGRLSDVDASERAFNAAMDLVDQLNKAIDVYTIEIREAEAARDAAEAQASLARINLERTQAVAPFDARVKSVHLEVGQYVAPGANVLTLADDSVLEISVPIDSRDARRWLKFSAEPLAQGTSWFHRVEPVVCEIRWTEETNGHCWEGVLDRVELFDPDTRTLIVAMRISGEGALSKDMDMLPLVEGMFCNVTIPGKLLQNAYRVPHWAVSYENIVYLSDENRLRTTPVEVTWQYGEDKFITGGLQPNDVVITTRLVNPLDGQLLEDAAAQPEEPVS